LFALGAIAGRMILSSVLCPLSSGFFMHFQFEVTQPQAGVATPPGGPGSDPAELLRQLVDVQREQLALMRALVTAHDAGSRWRAVLARFQEDFPGLPKACKQILPTLERAYVDLVSELTSNLQQQSDDGALENEFALADLLDRSGQPLRPAAPFLNDGTSLRSVRQLHPRDSVPTFM